MRAAFICVCLAASPLAAQDNGEPFLDLDDDVAEALNLVEDEPVAPEEAASSAPPVSSLLSECAAILAVASSTTSSFVERDRLRAGAAQWFATSGDLALQEGRMPDEKEWADAVQRWAGRISSINALGRHEGWARSCVELGGAHNLDASVFAANLDPALSAEAESEPPVATE